MRRQRPQGPGAGRASASRRSCHQLRRHREAPACGSRHRTGQSRILSVPSTMWAVPKRRPRRNRHPWIPAVFRRCRGRAPDRPAAWARDRSRGHRVDQASGRHASGDGPMPSGRASRDAVPCRATNRRTTGPAILRGPSSGGRDPSADARGRHHRAIPVPRHATGRHSDRRRAGPQPRSGSIRQPRRATAGPKAPSRRHPRRCNSGYATASNNHPAPHSS
jgi:hypothetical protein